MMKSRILTMLTSCLLFWGGGLLAFSAPDDDFNPENPADPSAINYCRLTVTADPAEGAYVSGSGRYTVGKDGQVYISTSERNTEEYTYTFLYWTLNGEKTSYSQNFFFTPLKGTFEFVAHYEKNEVAFDPESPQDPSSTNIKRKYRLYLTSDIEGACTFNMSSGDKIEEEKNLWLNVYYQSSYYKFEGWKLNGTIISTSESFYYTMPSAETTLQACFSEIPFDPDNPQDPESNVTNVDNSKRMLMDIHIGDADKNVDKTRVVINEAKTLGYDTGVDAAKMISNNADFQIYSLDAGMNKYSINERPKDNGIIPIGVILKASGNAYISASRLDCSAVLKDKLLNKIHDLAVGKYMFTADAGTINDRFELMVTQEDAVVVTAKSYSRAYGEANPTFEFASSGEKLIGIPQITCEATVTSPVGTYPIVISKGSVTNTKDTYVNGTLTITKAPLKVKAGTYTRKQGEENPDFTLEYEGFKNGETEAVLTKKPVATTTATKESAVGDYAVTVSGGESQNYELSYVSGTLKVTNADAVVVTAKSYSRAYGETNPTFEYTSEGAALTGIPEITCEATAASPVGTYDIIIKKGSVTNYNDSYVNGTLTITKAPLKVKAGTYTRKQGEENPDFTLEYEGFKNGETEAVLTKKPVATTTATKESAVGDYAVTVSGGEAQNYELSYVSGTLKVTEADPVVVKAKSYSRVYGEANPKFEYTSEGAALMGTPVITCEATAKSPVGTYPIVIKKGSVTNSKANYVNGTLTVKKAQLTITAKSYRIKQGEPLPKFEITYSGFKNGETKSVLTKQPKVTCSATSTNEPGTYTIIVSGATANNYEISHVKGTLRILDLSAPTLLGDINYDGEVDVTDVVELIDMVLGSIFDPIGDINGDGEVDVTDVVELIDIVLGN